jgi:hypothetical protein
VPLAETVSGDGGLVAAGKIFRRQCEQPDTADMEELPRRGAASHGPGVFHNLTAPRARPAVLVSGP